MSQLQNSIQNSQQHRFAFIHATWHLDVVQEARDAFIAEMAVQGVPASCIDVLAVPGAFEIPLLAQRLAKTGDYSGIVACAFVVNGGIYRHEFVSDAVVKALMDVQLATDVPVFSAVLTPVNFHEHAVHQDFFRQHFVTKGAEVARACMETMAILQKI